MAGGVAAGAAGVLLVSAAPTSATNGDPLVLGSQAIPTVGTVQISGIDYTNSGVYFSPFQRPVFSVSDNAAFNVVPAAVLGVATRNNVVGVAGAGVSYDLFAAGSGVIGMVPAVPVGPPVAGAWQHGDLIEDNQGNLFVCVVSGSPGVWRKLAGPTSAGAFHAISPQRVYDSRNAGGKLAGGAERDVSMVGPNPGTAVVPAGAVAVAITLTVTETEGVGGWLAVRPNGTGFAGTSSINWFGPDQNIATTVISGLGGDRLLTIHGGVASTHFIVDVTGYYR